MVEIRVEPASSARWADVEHAMTGGGDGGSCWCQWFTIPRAEFRATPKDGLRDLLRTEVASVSPSPGLVAYVDGNAAGWMRVGPRPAQPTLLRARVVTGGGAEPLDDPTVWAITCFVIRREARGLGLSKRLIEAGLTLAESHGARMVEAYPFDTEQQPKRVNELFVGTVRLFAGLGFTETARPFGARVVMARELTGHP